MCQYSSTRRLRQRLAPRAPRAAGPSAAPASSSPRRRPSSPRGRISPADLGIWDDQHVPGLQRIAAFIRAQGAVAGIQLAHAGRKASTAPPWQGGTARVPARRRRLAARGAERDRLRRERRRCPRRSIATASSDVVAAFRRAAARARDGRVPGGRDPRRARLPHPRVPVAAHNHRTDEYGGSYDNRTRLLKQVCKAVREEWPAEHAALRARVGDRLGRGRLARRGHRGAGPSPVELRRRSHRLLVGRHRARASPSRPGPGYQVPFSQRIKDTSRC